VSRPTANSLAAPALLAALDAGDTLLAPNTELTAALFDAVERHHRETGRQIWRTPRIRDFGSWLREQHTGRQYLDASAARCLSDIEERELWREVVLEGESGENFLDVGGAARSARRARRAILEYGIPLTAVAQYATDESHALLGWIRSFEERCRALGCIAADELLGSLTGTSAAVAWIESPIWRPVARRWLASRGREIAAANLAASQSSRRRLHAGSPALELAAAADWALSNLRADPDFRAWICVPDLSLRRTEVIDAFDAALAPQRFSLSDDDALVPYAAAGGTPLADYAPVRAALQTLAASSGVLPFERYSALLRAPELQASTAEAGAAAVLDVHLRSRAPSEAGLPEWLALSDRVARDHALGSIAATQRLHAALQVLMSLHGSHHLSRWVSIWVAALESGPWALRHRWSSIEYQSAERFKELLASLACADSLLGAQSRRSAEAILTRAARDTAFQPQTGIPPIWVSGQIMDPWLNHDGLWIMGCDEEHWPAPVDPIPLLPVRLQRDFGVIPAGADSQLRFAEDLQLRWQARAASCVFSYADPGDGRSAAPSPLLSDAPPPTESEPRWPQDALLPQPHWHALLARAPALERLTDELAPPFDRDERTRGVSTLKAQSRCAFRGFAETRLLTDPLGRPVPGFNERERGELLHHALEHIWLELRSSTALKSLSPEAQAQLLDISVALALEKSCRARDPGLRWQRRERVRMHGLLAKWLDVERQRQDFDVERLEQESQAARHGGLEFNVRIDRIDRLSDGARVLIDYKSGVAAVDWRGDRPDNPQLPIYALLQPQALAAVAYGRVSAGDCRFIAESERPDIFKPRGRRSQMEGMPDLAALIALWSRRIEKLAADFAAGRAEVAPTLIACKSCRLQGLCRIPTTLDDMPTPHD
jgi:probable DNA repair protein